MPRLRAMTRRGCCGRRVQTMRACAYVVQSRDGEAAAQGGDGRRKGGRKTRERRDDEWRDDEVGGRSRFCRRRVERRVIGVWLSQDPSSGRGVETEGGRRWGVRVVIGCGGAGRMDQARGRRGSSAVRYHLGSLGVNADALVLVACREPARCDEGLVSDGGASSCLLPGHLEMRYATVPPSSGSACYTPGGADLRTASSDMEPLGSP